MSQRLQNVEDATDVTVSKYYLVPTVCVNPHVAVLRKVPVIGPLHEDAEFINFPYRHYHPDRRFVSRQWLEYYGSSIAGESAHWGAVYSFSVNGRDTGMFETGRQRMRCKRNVGTFREAPWLAKLELAYAGETLRDGHICPHRGISCRGVVAENGGVVCPGHGLKWNLETGHLISRTGQSLTPRLFK